MTRIEKLGNMFLWLYLLRVPLVIASTVVFLPLIVLRKMAAWTLVNGAFEAWPLGFGCIVLVLGFLVGSLHETTQVMVQHGLERLGYTAQGLAIGEQFAKCREWHAKHAAPVLVNAVTASDAERVALAEAMRHYHKELASFNAKHPLGASAWTVSQFLQL